MKNEESRSRHSSFFIRTSTLFILLFALLSCRERPLTTVKDDLGRDVPVPRRAARIVTLAPNVTELVFAIGAGSRIVGTDDSSDYPAAAKKLTKVGGMQPNVEKIASLKPDLVIASTEGNHPNLEPALKAIKVPLFVVKTDRLPEITASMNALGRILDVDADKAIATLDQAMKQQQRTRARQARVLFAVWPDPLYVAGRNTFTDDLYVLTGAQNAVKVNGWPQYSLESLVAEPPDLLLYPRGAVTPQQIASLLNRAPGLRTRVVPVNEDIFQRPGPRVADAAKALNAILDAFEKERK